MENTELKTTTSMSIEDMKNWYGQFIEFSKSILVDKLDFGTIPWVSKPSLLKPGAEKLRVFYGLSVKMDRTGETMDIEKDFYDVSYMATVSNKDGLVMAQCEWSANTCEDKYRYSWVATNKKPSKDEAEHLKAQKLGRWSKNWNDWVWMEKTEATNRLSLKNTIQKMAQKRAFVWAILMATGASEFFTQDVEDMNIGAEIVSVDTKSEKSEKSEVKTEIKEETKAEETTTKKWFNDPEFEELKTKPVFIASFESSADLIAEIKKNYLVSKTREVAIADLWAETAVDPTESIESPKQSDDTNTDDDLPF